MLKNFEEIIEQIQNELFSMGQKVVRSNNISLEAVKKNEQKLFLTAKNELSNISNMSDRIDNLVIKALALYKPEARDLRAMVSYLKITNEIVRAGANIKVFSKLFSKSMESNIDIKNILELSLPLQKASYNSIYIAINMIKLNKTEDIENSYQKVLVEENKADDLYSLIEKNLLKEISENIELSKNYLDILRALRKLDKITDRAQCIANLLLFAQVGGEIHQS